MKDYIIKNAQSNLEAYYSEWARNHFASAWNAQFDTDEAKTQVEAAKANMALIQSKIDFTLKYIEDNK